MAPAACRPAWGPGAGPLRAAVADGVGGGGGAAAGGGAGGVTSDGVVAGGGRWRRWRGLRAVGESRRRRRRGRRWVAGSAGGGVTGAGGVAVLAEGEPLVAVGGGGAHRVLGERRGRHRPGRALVPAGLAGDPGVAAPARAERVEQVLLELLPRRMRRVGARRRLLREHPVHPEGEGRRDLGGALGHGLRLLLDVGEQDRQRLAGAERHASRQQLVRDHARGVEVGPRPDLARHRLLGRHVGGSADRHAGRGPERARALLGQRLGDPEVGDLDPPVGGDHQVLGLEVAVDDARGVRVRQPGEHVLQHAADLRGLQPADPRAQRAARDVLHRDVLDAAVLEVVEDGDDARVVERARDARLAQEAADHLRVLALQRAELLQGDEAVEVELPGEVDARHPAAPDLAEDLEPTDAGHEPIVAVAPARGQARPTARAGAARPASPAGAPRGSPPARPRCRTPSGATPPSRPSCRAPARRRGHRRRAAGRRCRG